MTTRITIKRWWARKNGAPVISDVQIIGATDKAICATGHGAVDGPVLCARCGLHLTNKVSRWVGVGPICCGYWGLDWAIDENATPEELAAFRERLKIASTFEALWIPRSVIAGADPDLPVAIRQNTNGRTTAAGKVFLRGDSVVFKTPYNPPLVTAIRLMPGRAWDAEAKEWTVPVSERVVAEALSIASDFGLDADPELKAWLPPAPPVVTSADGLFPFQVESVAFALERRRCLIAHEMGLGKTVVALRTIAEANAYPAVIVCPKSVLHKWGREISRWIPGTAYQIIESGTGPLDPATSILVINYDILVRHEPALLALHPKAVVLDESQYVKNAKAQRSKSAAALAQGATYRLLLSGTPIRNRPVDLLNQLDIMGRLAEFGGWRGYVTHFCAAFQRRVARGRMVWDTSGASNLDELHEKLARSCMIRFTKKQVMQDLPPVQRVHTPMVLSEGSDYALAMSDFQTYLREKAGDSLEDVIRVMRSDAEALVRMTALRRTIADAKAASVIEWAQDFLESSGEKVLIFGWHRPFIESLAEALHAPSFTGATSAAQREAAIECFQTDPGCRVMVCNVEAAGMGIDLTAATHVAFAELPWSPSDIEQAIARAYGRLNDPHGVTAHYLLAEGTIDETLFRLMYWKEENTATAMGEESLLAGLAEEILA